MATYDQSGAVVDDLTPVQVTARKIDKATGGPVPELEEFAVTGKRYDWTGLVFALLAGVVVVILDGQRPRRRRRRR